MTAAAKTEKIRLLPWLAAAGGGELGRPVRGHHHGPAVRVAVRPGAVADAEGPLEPVPGDSPRGRQSRFHVARALAVLNEGLEDLARDQRDHSVESRGWIQDGGNGGQADSEEGTLSSRRCGRRQGGHHRYESADPPGHGVFYIKAPTRMCPGAALGVYRFDRCGTLAATMWHLWRLSRSSRTVAPNVLYFSSREGAGEVIAEPSPREARCT